ncbi:hypothetical protein GPECTOR_20g526 [Gonium pectorale]|uniref:BTB domain-containing protein n=1 Tax=Gonium pectorale TaxID=33097 RepID=A0A150GIN2_GONPE|nr:hypothetical protein GPECTOR_20g526 [Gonium pectorale]|eukprot:KXZ49669.1 hypothetical protein GPECTOR_20g526 [Gonium pectorale]
MDSSNVVSRAVGSKQLWGSSSKAPVAATAAAGAGNVYMAAKDRLLKVSGLAAGSQPTVTTLCGQAASSGDWVGLTFNPATQALVAATNDELYEVPTADGGGGVGGGSRQPISISANTGRYRCSTSPGCGFMFPWKPRHGVQGLLATVDGGVCILDGSSLLEMDEEYGDIRAVPGIDDMHGSLPTVTASGWLAIGALRERVLKLYGPGFRTRQYTPAPLVSFLGGVRAASSVDHGGGSSAAGSSNGSPVLTVRVGDRAFVAHRALLAEHSGYFRQLLASEGFAESGAAEMTLGEADPDVFGRLLFYMYSGVLYLLEPQLKAAAQLADRLMMPDVCEQLKPRLLAACTPATIISYLLWAEEHNLTALIPALKHFFLEHCKAVAEAVPAQLDELTARHPALAAELFRTVARQASRP